MLNKGLRYILFTASILIIGCAGEKEPEISVLARIGDKIITVDEFIRRSEYTIRPVWCRGENSVHRKIALNSLIAEKLLALEAGTETKIDHDPDIQAYLRGRKEQEMRQLHFQRTAMDDIVLEDQAFNLALKNSGRTYHVEIIPIGDDKIAGQIASDLNNNRITFAEISKEITNAGGTVQKLDLRFDSPLDDAVYKELFQSDNIKKGRVLGPIHLDKNANTLIKINGWTRRPVISDSEYNLRVKDVREKEIHVLAMDIYVDWIKELMHGKSINFNDRIFRELVNAVGPVYFEARVKSKQKMQKKYWQLKDDNQMIIDDITSRVDAIKDQTLFVIDDQVWTVERFEKELKVHPLVFRNSKMSKAQFGEQFKLAIADMIRDRYITADAYNKGYDKEIRLQQRYMIWEDNLRAEYKKQQILDEADSKDMNDVKIVQEILDPYVQMMFKKYSNQIEINTDSFEEIKLTDINMIVLQENVSFPIYVPNFPVLTTYNKLDYGKKYRINK